MKKRCFFLALLLTITFSFTACSDRLSEHEIQTLREQYPVYDVTAAPNASLIMKPLEEVAPEMETVMYVKVLGDIERSYVDLSDTMPVDMVESIKEKGFGFTLTAGFLTYQVEVIDDASGQYAPGDIVTATIPDIVETVIPTFHEGDRFIFMGGPDDEVEDEIDMNFRMYYVTEDGYALSSFQEEEENRLSGVKAEECVDYIFDLVQ